jgi:hypothetical protein
MLIKKLRVSQEEAVSRAMEHDGFFLFMEQRTGKTLTALAIAEKRKPAVIFIITILKGIRVWKEEIKQSLKIDWPCQVVITHYQGLYKHRKTWRAKFREWKKASKDAIIICDESHFIKKRGSKIGRVVRSIGKLARYRLALTGTPLSPRSSVKRRKRTAPKLTVLSGMQDAWAQFDFINPAVFGKYEKFQKKYLLLGGFRGFQVIGYRNQKHFNKILHQYSYRKLLKEIQEKQTKIRRIKVSFKLDKRTRKAYDLMDRKMYTIVNGRRIAIPLLVSRTIKLQQIAGGFIKDTEENEILDIGLSKLERLERLLERIVSKDHGEKVVICAKFIHELDLIERLCSSMGLTHQTIKGGVEFDGEFNVQVMLIQIQSGVAIDLAKANSFIFYSLSHKHIDYEQAKFRILSYSKQRATYYYLLAKDTIDELVYEACTKKKDLITLILDHYRRNQNEQFARTRGSRRIQPLSQRGDRRRRRRGPGQRRWQRVGQ